MTESTIKIPFASNKHATIAKQVIEVDAELQAQAVKRTLKVKDEMLIAYVIARFPQIEQSQRLSLTEHSAP